MGRVETDFCKQVSDELKYLKRYYSLHFVARKTSVASSAIYDFFNGKPVKTEVTYNKIMAFYNIVQGIKNER